MNAKHIAIGITAAVMLASSAFAFAADAPKTETPKAESLKKPLGKLTCEDFVGIDDVIKPQYVIAAVAHTKGGKAKNVVIEVVDTDTLVPFLIEECQKAPKESFWAKLKSKLKL
jgi:hypothetical protein